MDILRCDKMDDDRNDGPYDERRCMVRCGMPTVDTIGMAAFVAAKERSN